MMSISLVKVVEDSGFGYDDFQFANFYGIRDLFLTFDTVDELEATMIAGCIMGFFGKTTI